jgi:hypothetical protein
MRLVITFIVALWLCSSALLTFGSISYVKAQTSEFTWTVKITNQQTHDFSGIQFFELRHGAVAALLSVDGQSELAAFLRLHDGERVVFRMESGE